MEAEKSRFSIVVLGKSGAGKSSFSNYLFEKDIFTTGEGRAVTGWENNFQSFTFDTDNYSIEVFDSVGLEPANALRWKKEVADFLAKYEWSEGQVHLNVIHGIFYIINGATGRVENEEITVIKEFMKMDVPVHVIVSNADIAGDEKLTGIENALAANQIVNVYRISSIPMRLRGGEVTVRFGRDEVIRAFLAGTFRHYGMKMILHIMSIIEKEMKLFESKIMNTIDDLNLSLFNIPNWENEFNRLIEFDFDGYLDAKIDDYRSTWESYEKFFTSFDCDTDELEKVVKFDELLEALDVKTAALLDDLNEITEDIESGDTARVLAGGVKAGKLLLNLKGVVKKKTGEIFHFLRERMMIMEQEVEAFVTG